MTKESTENSTESLDNEVIVETVAKPAKKPKKAKEMTDDEEAAAIKNRIQELKDNAVKNHNMEAVRGLMAQLPDEKTASENGTPIDEYDAKVMASQSSDITVVPTLLGIAKTRKALKKQGYQLEEIEDVIDKLEKAYEI